MAKNEGAVAKLIEVVKPFIDAKAEGTKIKAIGAAERQNVKANLKLAERLARDGHSEVGGTLNELVARAATRVEQQEVRRQMAIEAVVRSAIEQTEEDANDTPVDPGWLIQFMNLAQEISAPEMQIAFGTVLARESARPGAHSIRALHALSLMSREDADLLTYWARRSMFLADIVTIVFPSSPDVPLNRDDFKAMGLSFARFHDGVAMGLFIERTDLMLNVDKEIRLNLGPMQKTLVKFAPTTGMFTFRVLRVTQLGRELLSLPRVEFDMEFWQLFVDAQVELGYTVEIVGGQERPKSSTKRKPKPESPS